MIVAVAALLLAASLSVGLRATSGWLEHCHPIDRLVLSVVIGGLLIAASLLISARYGIAAAGYGLAFSIAPVGLFDVTKWWFRSRRSRTAWLVRSNAAPLWIAVRWTVLLLSVAGIAWIGVLQWQAWPASVPAAAPGTIQGPPRPVAPGEPFEPFDPTDPRLNPPQG
jgi:hypothetical protein